MFDENSESNKYLKIFKPTELLEKYEEKLLDLGVKEKDAIEQDSINVQKKENSLAKSKWITKVLKFLFKRLILLFKNNDEWIIEIDDGIEKHKENGTYDVENLKMLSC